MPVRIERRESIALLWLDRPERRNAFDADMWSSLRACCEELAAEPPRAVVVVGMGEHFSSGMDLSMSNPLLPRLAPAVMGKDDAALRAIIEELKADVQGLADLPCPVIAAVEGSCLGGALEVALCCDLIVATTASRFAMPETRWGMVPDVGGTTRLTRRIGRGRAGDLILTGRHLSGEEAAAWGLVERSCAPGTALETALEVAAAVCANAPTATREALRVLRRVEERDDAASFEHETQAGIAALASGEVLEGMQAFAIKRPPNW